MKQQWPLRKPGLKLLTLILSTLATASVLACGPDFPVTLLDHRALVMGSLPEGTFDFEAQHLVDRGEASFPLVEADPWSDVEAARLTAENLGLSDGAAETVAAMRAASSPEAALALAAGLAPELARYTAGAVAWQQGDIERAQSEFQAVTAMPAADRPLRGVWASYMLGRALAQSGNPEAAVAAFEQTRDWVAHGASDALGLALASLGEQARVERDAGRLASAVRLYAEQAAYGSSSGRYSLLFVARSAIRDQAQVDALLADEVGTRLLLAYLYTRYNELIDAAPEDEYPSFDASSDGPRLLALLDRIAAAPGAPGSDRLAAIAYRAGRFEQAAQVAAPLKTPLAAWIRAKLAVREGQMDVAARAYAEAAKGFPASESWGQVPFASEYFEREQLKPQCRVQAEAGTLALSRGDYLQAMELLYAAADTYWADAAYVAERVLTVDELKAFVDRVAPVAVGAPEASHDDASEEEEAVYSLPPPPKQLRALLARRLLREARFDLALNYFDDAVIHGQAERYIAARENGSSRWTRTGRARAWYEAAEIARWYGMELLGYEQDPDYFIWGGSFDLNSPITWDEDFNPVFNPRSDLKVEGPFTSADERARVSASIAQPLERFHYRVVAAGLAGQAADALPPRSQAFAAVLCEATRWLIDRHNEDAVNIYRRYLREGAFVPWGESFGRECPVPDFDKVEQQLQQAWMQKARRVAIVGAPIVLLLGFAALYLRRRRVRAAGNPG